MTDLQTKHGGSQLADFLSSLLAPLQTNTNSLKTFETLVNKEAVWNGRKMVLQAALNDLFGITIAPFIIIVPNQALTGNLYFSEPSELTPVYFGEVSENDPVYFGEPSEITSDFDFTVKIPVGIATTEVQRRVKAYVNLYKVVGPSFNIITY